MAGLIIHVKNNIRKKNHLVLNTFCITINKKKKTSAGLNLLLSNFFFNFIS